MVFVACGLNHTTAPLDVREQFALSMGNDDRLLHRFIDLSEINEAAILSTCNRTEIYCDTQDPTQIIPWLANEQHLSPELIAPYFYMHSENQGVKHTLRVASGLDSMMLGEPQILGQMKQAYQIANNAGAIGSNLRHMFQYVFQASKRVRNRSGIGNNPVSVAFAASQLVAQLFTNIEALNVFLIGSGETSSLVAKYLHQQGVRQFMIANRTDAKAQQLATQYAGKTIPIVDIPKYLSQADVIISATTCPLPFISKSMVEQALQQRNNAPMFFLDLAVPRDIESNVNQLPGVHLYNIDDLHDLTEKGMNERRSAAQKAEQLVDMELDNYIRWHRSLRAKQVICDYRTQVQDLAQLELQRSMQKLSAGQCQYHVLSEFSQRLINKLTHIPTIGLRQAAVDNRDELFDLAHYLFNVAQTSHEEIT
ncbi:MAG: glutamyl-tRNA reductase [Legionellaceae bacterium]|nr:glutamyl-tRNA reductase [Legionellaceae bacterium]